MNYKGIVRILGNILLLEACSFLPAMMIAWYDEDYHVLWAFLLSASILAVLSVICRIISHKGGSTFFAREGFLLVSAAWIIMSAFGALPFFISGEIPSYIDAFFETVSGFTTTGASILTDVEAMSRGLLFWRSFTHWLGGMGILVLMLAILPAAKGKGDSLYVLRAESPGPSIEKIVPTVRRHAGILYGIYFGMTLLCFGLLFVGGMPLFDSLCITFGTAGTGGFGILSDSMASYSVYSQVVVGIFMFLFGVNFNVFFLLLLRRFKAALGDEELRVYSAIILTAVFLIAVNICNSAGSVLEAVHSSAFTVSSIITTTGYSTVDFNAWPEFSRGILVVLMLTGACAGSTGGGIKISRIIILLKSMYRGLRKLLHPRSVMLVRLNKQVVSESTVHGVNIYATAYALILIVSYLVISIDNFSMETNFTAVLSCISNIGPGLGAVGPLGSFSGYSALGKLVLSADMLLGRLEIFPLLLLCHYRTWRRAA